MDTESKKKSTNILKKILAPLKKNDKDSEQKQQCHDNPPLTTAAAVDTSKLHESAKISALTHSLASSSLSTKAKHVNSKRNLESITLIWYDSNIDKTNDTKKTMNELREINNGVVFHTDQEVCIDDIKSIATEKIFLVTSGRDATMILEEIHALTQVDSIFIFCFKPKKYQNLLQKFSKLIGIYTERQDLLNALKENIILVEKHLETFSFYSQHKQKTTRDLSKESAEFLWFQMFKDVILRLPRDSHAKQQMIEFCRHYYHGNEKELKFIREFEHDYKSSIAIRWYTKETFLYKTINKALRTEDIEQLHTFRFFIADLSLNLAAEYEKLKKKGEKIIMLYRGLQIERKELKTLKQNEGSLISTNGFLSTSRSKKQALKFATRSTKRTDVVAVLYEIECNIEQTDSIIFADIAKFSDYPDEEEVLFDLGTTFEIVSVKEDEKLNLCLIKLRANDKGSKVAKEHIELNRKDEEETSIELIFGKLLIDMGQYDQSLKYFQSLLLHDHTQKDDIAKINNLVGSTYYNKGDLEKAREYYKLAYNLMMNDKPIRIKDSARPLTNIGLIYHRKGQYDRALELYSTSIQIFETYCGKENIKTTKTLTNIGNIYTETRKYKRALQYYEEVLKIQQKCLPFDHIETAMTLNNIAVVYQKLNYLDCAIEYYQQSLNMKQKILPPDHKDIAVTRNNVVKINERKPHLQHAINAVPIPKARARNMLQYSPTNSATESDKLHYPISREDSPELHFELQYCCKMEERPELDYAPLGFLSKSPELDYEVEEYGTNDEDSAELYYTTSSSPRHKVSEKSNTSSVRPSRYSPELQYAECMNYKPGLSIFYQNQRLPAVLKKTDG
ncbi:unnamed protein product [Rotaria sp. Silwood2]|nr:unnamed protein product [Rotaria sp. Silwood2]CAF4442903.1 unnamed protein product [Rotaria sp. Silwood2]